MGGERGVLTTEEPIRFGGTKHKLFVCFKAQFILFLYLFGQDCVEK